MVNVCRAFNCIATNEVKREAVDEGKKRMHPDADTIEELIKSGLLKIKNPKNSVETADSLGKGELSILALNKEVKNHIIVSDDHAFLKKLEEENHDFLVPADLIPLLKNLNKISQNEAAECLEKMKAFIKESHYGRIKKQLEGK